MPMMRGRSRAWAAGPCGPVGPVLPVGPVAPGAPGRLGPVAPAGPVGPQGPAAQVLDLPRIIGINWPHGATIDMVKNKDIFDRLRADGLVIAFDRPMQANTLSEQSVQLLIKQPSATTYVYANLQLSDSATGPSPAAGSVTALKEVTPSQPGQCGETPSGAGYFAPASAPATIAALGTRIRPASDPTNVGGGWRPGVYRVVLEGNFILGLKTIKVPDPSDPTKTIEVQPALDANHLGPGLQPKGAPASRCPTGDRVEGGRFLSWFTITAPDTKP